MRITGPIPERIRKLMPAEERTTKATMTNEDFAFMEEQRTEKELQSLICDYLRINEIAYCCQRMDRKSNVAEGWPDIVFAWGGIPFAFEVKVGTNDQTPEQKAMQSAMERNGWRYFVVRKFDEAVQAVRKGVI